jgi:predicted XRE-type DNA-binding protein
MPERSKNNPNPCQLRNSRADNAAQIAALRDQIGVLSQENISIRNSLSDIRKQIRDMRYEIEWVAGAADGSRAAKQPPRPERAGLLDELGGAPTGAMDASTSRFAPKELSLRVVQKMKEHGLNQLELAAQIGVSQPAIHKLMTGKIWRPRNLTKLALALKTTPRWLMKGEEDGAGGEN